MEGIVDANQFKGAFEDAQKTNESARSGAAPAAGEDEPAAERGDDKKTEEVSTRRLDIEATMNTVILIELDRTRCS
jgi:hypothetical protein